MHSHFVGFDVHKQLIFFCSKRADGEIVEEGKFKATRGDLDAWLKTAPGDWIGGLVRTLFLMLLAGLLAWLLSWAGMLHDPGYGPGCC